MPKSTDTTSSTITTPCGPILPAGQQDAARSDAAPPGPGREQQLMNGLIWSALCLTEDAAHKLYDCDARRGCDRADPTLQSAIRDLRAALACLTQEAE